MSWFRRMGEVPCASHSSSPAWAGIPGESLASSSCSRAPLPHSRGLRDDRYRLTQWIDFASGRVLAEEFYDYHQAQPEQKNQIHNARYAEAIQTLRPKLQAFIQVRAK